MPKVDFQCICCGYTTSKKSSMKDHLYKKKIPCPKSVNDIELSEEIKEYILTNRVYHLPSKQQLHPQPTTIINQQINNYNQINNFISSMDFEEKLMKFLKHKGLSISDFEDKVDDTYASHVEKLEENKVRNYQLNIHNLLEVFDNMTSLNEYAENLNVYYDQVSNKLKIFQNGKWRSFLIDVGLHFMISVIQENYLNYYECYLIRKELASQGIVQDLIEDYYHFLACFHAFPFAYNKSNGDVLNGNEDDNYDITDKWSNVYMRIRDDMKPGESNKVKKQLSDIIKHNTQSNIKDLNKMIMDMLHIDPDFKAAMLERL